MMDTSMRLRSGQYDFKVPYNGIKALYLLDKPDGQRHAFVISLDMPIRQGQQKYQHLVWETHGLESSVDVNLSEEDCRSKYDGILEPVMKGPMSTIIAKVFKVLTQNKVLDITRRFSVINAIL
jgi:structure-specific recognition protein 1